MSWDTVSPGYRPLSWGYAGVPRMPPVSQDAKPRLQTSGSGQCLSLISFELVRGLTAVVYRRHTGGKASSPHKWGKAGYADHLGRLSVTRANRVQLDSLHAGEWVRVGYAARYGVLVGWLRGLRAVQASGWSCRGWSVGLVCVCALYSSTKLDVIVVAS